jgi:hypothetical protein
MSAMAVMVEILSFHQAQGRTHAVRSVLVQMGEQRPPRTMHAAPGPSSSWQSESWLQNRQIVLGLAPSKLAQKPALPVVSVQKQRELLELHGTS